MSNPNQRVPGSYGDIFTPNTSYTDRAAATIYSDEKRRAAEQQAKNAALDEEFAKNMSNIRDADIPEAVKRYGDWKLSVQAAMRKKDGVSPTEQLAILGKKADIYNILSASKQRKQYEDETGKAIIANPDNFEDDAQKTLIGHRNTPLAQLKSTGQDAYDYKYKGTNTDFSKIDTTASGQLKQTYSKETPMTDGIQTQITPYIFGNTPAQYHDNVIGALSLHKSGRDAAAIVSSWTPEVLKGVQDQYNAIPIEKWQRMGLDKPQNLDILPTDSKAEIFAKHNAQLYALNHEPKEGTPVFRTNESAKMDKEYGDWLKKNAITNAQENQRQLRAQFHAEKMAKDKLGVGAEVNINDIYKNIDDATNTFGSGITQSGVRVGTRVNALSSDAQKVVVDYANKLLPGAKLGNNNLYIHKEPDGTIKLYKTENSDAKKPNRVIKDEAHLIGELPRVTVNLPAQPGIKEKRAVIHQGNITKPTKGKLY